MTWLQDAQQTLREKMSRAEDFYSQMLLRQGFRNWLKVGLHHSGEMIPRELAAATLSPHHSANSLTCSTTFAEFCYPYSSNIIPFFRDLLSAPHSPSLSSTQNFLLHTASPPSTLSTLLPAGFPPLLCPLPFTATISALLYLLGQRLGEKRRKKAILTCFFVLLPSTRIISPLRKREQIPSTQSAS